MLHQIKKVLVIYVGGTIGMEKNKNNVYTPTPNKLLEKLKSNVQMHCPQTSQKYFKSLKANQLVLPEFDDCVVITYELKEYYPLLDSSNMSVDEWIRVAKDIESNYLVYDGFVVLHGTDTLAYTSSALSFMLEGLQKPVVITGSQIPIFETRSDAKDNVLASLIFAGCYKIPEVCVFFANKLLRGNRTSKISSTHLNAFDSPNYYPLAETGIEITINKFSIMDPPTVPFQVHSKLSQNVAILHFFPTITAEMFRAIVRCPAVQGLVLESYGAGNIPSKQTELLQILKEAVDNDTVIVNITQCSKGSVQFTYEAGKVLDDIGIICGCDMTPEAALTKLCYVLGISGLSYKEKIALMKQNLRGELTFNSNYH